MADTLLSCIRLVPYRQFKDGTWGSILVLDWMSGTPTAFLFNSTDRKKEAPNTTRNTLLPAEEELYSRYIKECEQAKTGNILPAKEAYNRYEVARLAGHLISAHIADMICENLNLHDPRTNRNTQRASQMIAAAQENNTLPDPEKELLNHMEETSIWERTILEQTLPLITPAYNHQQWIETTLPSVQIKNYRTKEESGIWAVYAAGICKSKADWGAVFKILAERKIVTRTSYLAGARIINQVCGKEVTSDSAIKQSPALAIINGTLVKGWTDKAHNRQSSNLLLHYKDIAKVFMNA